MTMRQGWALLGVVLLAGCGGKVRFEGDDGSACDGLGCGENCDGGGVCDETGQCRFDDFICPAECVAGLCGEPCTACEGDECFDGICDVDLFCRRSAICPTE
jgi:hypothetical protein